MFIKNAFQWLALRQGSHDGIVPSLIRTIRNRERIQRVCRCLMIATLFASQCRESAAQSRNDNRLTVSPWDVKDQHFYEHMFHPDKGWIGGDGAGSVLLSQGRILWLFGDSLYGRIVHERRLIQSMVNNSIAIQSGLNPQDAQLSFFPVVTINHSKAFVTPKHGKGWFWLSQGAIRNRRGLFLFMPKFEGTSGSNGWNFEMTGMVLGKISNPDANPTHWMISQASVPFFRSDSSGKGLSFGVSVIQVGSWTYIYGLYYEKRSGRRCLLLARSRSENLGNFSSWEFLCDGHWSTNFMKASPLCDHLGAECSVSWLPSISRYVLICTENGLSDKIIMRCAPSPSGPWSDAKPVYRTPRSSPGRDTFCYAAKAHPELSLRDDELIISYVCNTTDPSLLVSDPGIYVPKFIRVKFRSPSIH